MNLKGIRRFLLIIVVIALIQLLGGCPAPEQKAAKYESVKAELDKLIKEEMARGGITGLSIALVDDQEIVWAQGFGFADKDKKIEAGKDTVYRVGSISKLFTDLSVMKLQEEGKLSIDEDITKYVPEFYMERPFETDKPTTLRQLMAHCSGFLRESPVGSYFDDTEPSIKATVESIYGLPLVYPPETKMKYSNIGVTLVGYTVQRVSGEPFEDYVRENLLRPIGMESSDYVLTDKIKEKLSAAYMWVAEGDTAEGRRIEARAFKLGTVPAGNLYSTVEDLCRFHSFIFTAGKAGDERIIEEKTLEQMLTKQFETEGAARAFGIGFVTGDLNGHKTYGHGGAVYGFSSSFIGMPDQKIGVVVLANEDVANSITDKIAVRALALMLAAKTGEKAPEPEKTIEPAPAALAKLVGTYESPGYWAKVEERDGKLYINYSGQKADMEAVGDKEFNVIGRGLAGRIAFTVAEDGSVNGFKVGEMEFVRIDPNAVYEYPDVWDKLVGAYGPDFIPTLVSVKYGHLYAFMENVFDYRLEQVSDTVYKFNYGLYEGENLEFFLAPDGTVERIVMAHVEFEPIK